MDTSTPPPQKQGLGPLAWIGIGCGGIVALCILGFVVVTMMYGGKIKQFAEDVQKNPTRTMATTMVTMSAGQFEMIAEDDAKKRYTVREKSTGKLTTIYWSEKAKAPDTVQGDFTAIPSEDSAPSAPAEASAPAPAPGEGTLTPDRK